MQVARYRYLCLFPAAALCAAALFGAYRAASSPWVHASPSYISRLAPSSPRVATFWLVDLHSATRCDAAATLARGLGQRVLLAGALAGRAVQHAPCRPAAGYGIEVAARPASPAEQALADVSAVAPEAALRAVFEHYRDDPQFLKVDAVVCMFPTAACEIWLPLNRTLIWLPAHRYALGRCGSAARWAALDAHLQGAGRRGEIVAASGPYDAAYLNYYTGLRPVLLPATALWYAAPPHTQWTGTHSDVLVGPLQRREVPHLEALRRAAAAHAAASGGGAPPLAFSTLKRTTEGGEKSRGGDGGGGGGGNGWGGGGGFRDVERPEETAEMRAALSVILSGRSKMAMNLLLRRGSGGAAARRRLAAAPQVPPPQPASPSFLQIAAAYRAAVVFPYAVLSYGVTELYAVGVPLFVPTPELLLDLGDVDDRRAGDQFYCGAAAAAAAPPRHNGSLHALDPESTQRDAALYWLRLADVYTWPHIQLFASFDHLMRLLNATDFRAVHVAMLAENASRAKDAAAAWRRVIAALPASGRGVPQSYEEARRWVMGGDAQIQADYEWEDGG